jgi:membrane-associated protease RseP (regulator of RpoE activity)
MIATAAIAVAWRLTCVPVLYLVAVMSCGVAVMNLIPFLSLDGYWLVSHALGVANLRDKRRAVFATAWAKLRGHRNQGRRRLPSS